MCAVSGQLPLSRKLLREKTFANWWKIWFSWRKLSRIACFCCAKWRHIPKFYGKKLLRIATKPQNSPKFSPSKVSCCTVYCQSTELHVSPSALHLIPSDWLVFSISFPQFCLKSLKLSSNFCAHPHSQNFVPTHKSLGMWPTQFCWTSSSPPLIHRPQTAAPTFKMHSSSSVLCSSWPPCSSPQKTLSTDLDTWSGRDTHTLWLQNTVTTAYCLLYGRFQRMFNVPVS